MHLRFSHPTDDTCVGWVPDLTDKRNKYELLTMSGSAFLKIVDPTFGPFSDNFRVSSIQHLTSLARRSACFSPLQMWPKRPREDGVLPHEGRHRAYLAAQDMVVVAVWR